MGIVHYLPSFINVLNSKQIDCINPLAILFTTLDHVACAFFLFIVDFSNYYDTIYLNIKLIGGVIMNLDAEQISKKNSVVTLVYALTFGYLGAHRFYVGKWKSGLIYLIFGSVFPLVNILQKISEVSDMNFALKASGVFTIAYILVECAMLYDIFALYSQSFTDCCGKIVIGGSEKDEIIGRTMEEKFNDNLSIAVSLFIFILIFLIYFVIL